MAFMRERRLQDFGWFLQKIEFCQKNFWYGGGGGHSIQSNGESDRFSNANSAMALLMNDEYRIMQLIAISN